MTAEELKLEHLDRHPESTFFHESWLKAMGVNMEESEVTGPVQIETRDGPKQCYILTELRHNHPMGPTREEAYFDIHDFQVVRLG